MLPKQKKQQVFTFEKLEPEDVFQMHVLVLVLKNNCMSASLLLVGSLWSILALTGVHKLWRCLKISLGTSACRLHNILMQKYQSGFTVSSQ